ncbi:transcription initiation factor IIA subunit 1-like [Cynara cardunculus var. scolymus]|uniref:transcription initiation factor IIA subunit 1-like n=1 Tax=Cynara cardunculus var. scolymus TaxID=59895 RepID=UPI000D62AA78|nr:transcription initiation factor IIA subunit 1-like [Cynara cardunculus var. scolymus]
MESPSTSTVYIRIIEDVINKVREKCVRNGRLNGDILNEFRAEWETRLMNLGAIVGPIDRSATKLTAPRDPEDSLQGLNVPYGGPQAYETSTADSLYPRWKSQTPLQTPIKTPLPAQTPLTGRAPTLLPGTVDSSCNIPITPNDYPPQPPSPSLNPGPSLDGNIAYEETDRRAAQAHEPMTQDFLDLSFGKRKRDDLPSQHRPVRYIPQQDGAGDIIDDKFEAGQGSNPLFDTIIDELELSPKIPQLDGQAPTSASVNPDDEDEPLNENDDDDDDLPQAEADELDRRNLILTMYDRVTRSKRKWRCLMRNGIIHIDHKETLFSQALGEFQF